MKKILYVYTRTGAPLAHSLPRIAACGELHLLAIGTLPTVESDRWRPVCASVTEVNISGCTGDAVVELLVEHAKKVAADAIMTLSEFAVIAVAEAARQLGLKGAGPVVVRSRDKALMRETWASAGVPVPRFHRVATIDDLQTGFDLLSPPLLLKAAWSAGSISQFVIDVPAELAPAWQAAAEAMAKAREAGFGELHEADTDSAFVLEEIIQGSTAGWYEPNTRYGPYVSVEGIVANGIYHPIGLTARMPSIPTFVEPANLAPCVLTESLQRKIEHVARMAVDALGLETCGTHTEIMLSADETLFVIESAPRFGGCMLTMEVEAVYGFDMIEMLTRELLGERVEYPERMLTAGNGAAASLALLATDSAGRPWQHQRLWDDSELDWAALVSTGTSVDVVEQMTLPRGRPIPAYGRSNGAMNWNGIFYVQAYDAETLLNDCYSILDNMQDVLPKAQQ